jgi:uncharacterized protein (DUF2267 family)
VPRSRIPIAATQFRGDGSKWETASLANPLQPVARLLMDGAILLAASPGGHGEATQDQRQQEVEMNERMFFNEVAEMVHCDRSRAKSLTFVVFQELRERITPKEAADVAAQLPAVLKRLWLENERGDRTVTRTHAVDFIGRVRQRAVLSDDAEAERGVRAVFGALQHLLGSPTGTEGEAWDVFSQLPKDLKLLWIESAKSH